MQTDVWYILNRQSNRFVKANGKIGQRIANSPAAIPALLIDTDAQTIRLSIPGEPFENYANTVAYAKQLIRFFYAGDISAHME